MNTLKSLLIFSILFISTSLIAGNTLSLSVKGMHCGGCETKFKTLATNINGIETVSEVSATEGTATIVYNEKVISAEKAIEELATQSGYTISAVTSMGAVSAEGTPAACCKKGTKAKCDKK